MIPAIVAVGLATVIGGALLWRVRRPKWSLSSWQADGAGHWVLQPVLRVDGKEQRFSTPDEYIAALRDIERRHPSAVEPVTHLVWQLERVREQFARADASDAVTVVERSPTPAG